MVACNPLSHEFSTTDSKDADPPWYKMITKQNLPPKPLVQMHLVTVVRAGGVSRTGLGYYERLEDLHGVPAHGREQG